MKRCIIQNKYRIIAMGIVLGIWWGMSKMYSPLVVPPIDAVCKEIANIMLSIQMWEEIGRTMWRLLVGLMIGICIGGITGALGGVSYGFAETWKPILSILQVIPPISWLILAIIWFGYNGRASIFIVAITVLPTIYICIPSVLPHFYSGLKIAIGVACKTVVMGEVLTTTTGIGGQIMTARLNIEPETVIAWTVIVVVIYYITVYSGILIRKIERGAYARYYKFKKRV